MTFEFIAKYADTVRLTAEPVTLRAGSPNSEQAVALRISRSAVLYVPLDRVEDVVAGIRDAARAASGQQPETTPCGSRSLPLSTGEVVRCVLHVGHAAQCQSAVEWPYVSWPNPSNGEGWRTVGQPAEARTADEAPLTAAERQFLTFALDLADNHMANRSDEFTTEDYEALAAFRRMAEEARS